MKEVWNGYYVIKYKDVIYKCFSIEDGYIKHICIYKDEFQIAELLKPNVVIDGKDEYRIYLRDEYNYLSDSLSLFALYLNRTEYNSSYLKKFRKNQLMQTNKLISCYKLTSILGILTERLTFLSLYEHLY